MLTDYYQVSMAYIYWKQGRQDEAACFELFFRKNPFNGEFTIFAGLDEALRFVANFRFTDADIVYLRKMLPEAEEGFFEWARHLDCRGLKIYAIREGTVVFPVEPLMRVHGPLAVAQLLETTLLNLVNYASLVCTNAARYRLTAGGDKKLFEFGTRRAQGPDGSLSASRYAYVGGFDGTSNVLAGMKLGLPVDGTHSHAFVQSYGGLDDLPASTTVNGVDIKGAALRWRATLGYDDDRLHDGELAAFVSYAISFPKKFVALVDTYSTLETGLKNFACVALALWEAGFQARGIRIDSGDLAYLSREARALFDGLAKRYPERASCLATVAITASNDINENVLASLRDQDHAIDAFGIGTHLVTCHAEPALGGVYKLVEINDRPTIKLSNDVSKTTIPCAKAPYRLISKNNLMLLDLLVPARYAPPEVNERVLCRHPFDHEKRVYVVPSVVIALHQLVFDGDADGQLARPSLEDIKRRVKKQLTLVREDILRRSNPTPYKVAVTPELFTFFLDIRQRNEPIVELT
ncbi:hypothetical protein CTAYLR_008729 [Chrysophaeum taylorii]|uniref:Nicotinate phosphoribosyltransferase n=1 Tax=Chrysophaeum taylorii TaxID=2483200 RepID=A0AAD7UKZ4_9STRA|nr:hypothetical protein CTAYLR_008729 [Chrysophaeum taylorii]